MFLWRNFRIFRKQGHKLKRCVEYSEFRRVFLCILETRLEKSRWRLYNDHKSQVKINNGNISRWVLLYVKHVMCMLYVSIHLTEQTKNEKKKRSRPDRNHWYLTLLFISRTVCFLNLFLFFVQLSYLEKSANLREVLRPLRPSAWCKRVHLFYTKDFWARIEASLDISCFQYQDFFLTFVRKIAVFFRIHSHSYGHCKDCINWTQTWIDTGGVTGKFLNPAFHI